MVEVINKSNNLDIKKELLEKINLEIGVNEGSKTSTSVINKETDKESAKKHYNSYNDDYETIYRDALDNDVALEYFDSDGESGEWFDSNR